MTIENLNELFLHELKDMYDAEQQLVEALPKLAEAASDPELTKAFRDHLEETRAHVSRLESVFTSLKEEPDREPCEGMEGILKEGMELVGEEVDPAVLDAALIAAAQRAEHYEIAAYGTLRVWAATAGLDEEAIASLGETLEEEKAADQKLTRIAEARVNLEAEAGGTSKPEVKEWEEEEEPATAATRTPARRRAKPARRPSSADRSRRPARASKPARSRRSKAP
ncbi:MAG: YciE/YciF ferroxidase family protein [Gemmatimonadales bacterium]